MKSCPRGFDPVAYTNTFFQFIEAKETENSAAQDQFCREKGWSSKSSLIDFLSCRQIEGETNEAYEARVGSQVWRTEHYTELAQQKQQGLDAFKARCEKAAEDLELLGETLPDLCYGRIPAMEEKDIDVLVEISEEPGTKFSKYVAEIQQDYRLKNQSKDFVVRYIVNYLPGLMRRNQDYKWALALASHPDETTMLEQEKRRALEKFLGTIVHYVHNICSKNNLYLPDDRMEKETEDLYPDPK
ncbi:hypothetical protein AGMMS49949_00920 [Alphaproteobacteria bacterium]|nr:hypothetical protein AGMMS49949_00920 [Alphaproteobacteria bacterium]